MKRKKKYDKREAPKAAVHENVKISFWALALDCGYKISAGDAEAFRKRLLYAAKESTPAKLQAEGYKRDAVTAMARHFTTKN